MLLNENIQIALKEISIKKEKYVGIEIKRYFLILSIFLYNIIYYKIRKCLLQAI